MSQCVTESLTQRHSPVLVHIYFNVLDFNYLKNGSVFTVQWTEHLSMNIILFNLNQEISNTTFSDEQASVCEGDLPHGLAGVVRGEEVRGRPLEGKGHLIPSRKFNTILPTRLKVI